MVQRNPQPDELEAIETASRDEIQALQLTRMKATLKAAYENVPHYRAAFDAAGVHPNDLKQLADLAKFPFTVKKDLRDNYPFGLFAVPRAAREGGRHCDAAARALRHSFAHRRSHRDRDDAGAGRSPAHRCGQGLQCRSRPHPGRDRRRPPATAGRRRPSDVHHAMPGRRGRDCRVRTSAARAVRRTAAAARARRAARGARGVAGAVALDHGLVRRTEPRAIEGRTGRRHGFAQRAARPADAFDAGGNAARDGGAGSHRCGVSETWPAWR